jgi:glycosyltransferase involved in cell wall biosynthesis
MDYINYLHESKYGIWIGCHESQGFALQEALSCNVPLLVWNVESMNQEYGCNYIDIPATTTPYWDERCGEYFYDSNNFEDIFNKFIFNIENYRPREYILENLSMEVCEKKLIDTINNINI